MKRYIKSNFYLAHRKKDKSVVNVYGPFDNDSAEEFVETHKLPKGEFYTIANSPNIEDAGQVAESSDFERKMVSKIKRLFNKEDITYTMVQGLEDDDYKAFIIAILYGDWKNNNDRGDELVKDNCNPTSSNYEDVDPYDYLRKAIASKLEGTDGCVTKYEWIWEK